MQARAVYTSLRRRAEFSRVHAQGRRLGDGLLQVRVLPNPAWREGDPPVRLGIIASKKLGPAVERNRFKRIVRAAIRELGGAFSPGWDILVLPRAVQGATMAQIRESLERLLAGLGVLRDGAEGGTTT